MTTTPNPDQPSSRQTVCRRPDGLELRRAGPADADQLLAFNTAIHGSISGTVTGYLLSGEHPGFTVEDFLVVVDGAERIVSTLCLIPVHWRLGQTNLIIGQVEFVGTHPEYRDRGLVRAQMEVVHRWMRERGMIFGAIDGIPYYYRQFGYDYAVDSPSAGVLLVAEHAGQVAAPAGIAVRPMREADVPALVRLDEERCADIDLTSASVPAAIGWFARVWQWDTNRAQGWIAERDGQPVGSCWVLDEDDVAWASSFTGTEESATALLAAALALPGINRIIVSEPHDSMVGRLVSSLGPEPKPPYAWYVRVNDPVQAFTALAGELERRLAASTCAGLSRTLTVSFYRSGLRVVFAEGRVLEVTPLPRVEEPDMRIPPDVLPKLLFGYRDVDQLIGVFPDLSPRHDVELMRILFPRCRSLVRLLV